MIHELTKLAPGMWRFPKNSEHCCIYRVPERLRRVNPEAYTPQLLLIGPLHHSLKSQALNSLGDITYTKLMGYLNMEEHKKIYLAEFAKRVDGKETIDGFKRIIEEDEDIIRASYSESTSWIESLEFVKMILHDSVFILEFLLRTYDKGANTEKTEDILMDEPCLQNTVHEDLILLENQLPYFILEKLFDPVITRLHQNLTFRELIVTYFGFQGKIGNNSKFKHFTDLFRCVRMETIGSRGSEADLKNKLDGFKNIEQMYNADKLDSAGVKFKAVEDQFSLEVEFVNGCLKIPCFWVRDDVEMTLRNIMALEQCHYPFNAYVCNYVMFLDFLVDTDKDVDLLVENGIIKNWIGHQSSVAEMVNKLSLGVVEVGSYYSDVALEVNAHYANPVNRSQAVLMRVYFGNLWTGTATIAATFLLLMTLVQTVASIIQVLQNA
ncbi:hypothetical protein AALP_AA5G261300 [Arabis alpina]|uniref:Uncharacterized protein n=1 Tax=Arabis alpina TaxID=50452 RepID=A0A087GZF1_ARAAL|nr:hypothetical protein AALP_AA5G261300 [Arabis alpina]